MSSGQSQNSDQELRCKIAASDGSRNEEEATTEFQRRDEEPDRHWKRSRVLINDFDKEGALRWFDEVLRRFDRSEDPDMEVHVAHAMYSNAEVLHSVGKGSDATLVFQRLIESHRDSSIAAVQDMVGRAMLNIADSTIKQKTDAENLETYTRIVDRLERGNHSLAALAHGRMGFFYKNTGRWQSALDEFDRMIVRLKEDAQSQRHELCWALYHKASTLALRHDWQAAANTYVQFLKIYDSDPSQDSAVLAAATLLEYGVVLGRLDRLNDELATYERLRQMFASTSESAIRDAVIGAIVNSIAVLRMLGRSDEANRLEHILGKENVTDAHRAISIAETNRHTQDVRQLQRYVGSADTEGPV